MSKYSVSVIGASGMTGGELLRILLRHPDVEIKDLFSRSAAGRCISDIHSFLRGTLSRKLKNPDPSGIPPADIIFLALPHTAAMEYVPASLRSARLVIDLSADYRFRSPEEYLKWYSKEHSDKENLDKAVYGIPEINRKDISGASLVANPGCYATAAILALYPLLKEGVLYGPVFIDAKSGISGAGKKLSPELLFINRFGNLTPYNVNRHRHMGEIISFLDAQTGRNPDGLVFCPHLVPVERGILSNLYVSTKKPLKSGELAEIFRSCYREEEFIYLCGEGEYPQLSDVSTTNMCFIGTSDSGNNSALVISAIDNLVKGASGQAVQNMNAALGIEENLGLR